MARSSREKKTDFAALQSPFMRVPRMKTEVARSLIEVGFREVFELQGRSAESIWAMIREKRPNTPPDQLPFIRMLVYYAETPSPEVRLLHPKAWE